MANEKVRFRRGPHDTIPSTKVPGTFLVETDTRYMFLDIGTGVDDRIQLTTDHVKSADAASQAEVLSRTDYIDGVEFNGANDVSHVSTCVTDASSQIKICLCDGLSLVEGARVIVVFIKGNTCTKDIVLNVNNAGVSPVLYKGSPLIRIFPANTVIEFVYCQGTWNVVEGLAEITKVASGGGLSLNSSNELQIDSLNTTFILDCE